MLPFSSLSSSVAGPSAMSSSSVANLSVVEARSVLSPMMRSLKDEIKKHIEDTIKDQLEASILMTAKKAKRTPRKTSSPVRRSPRLAERIDDEDDDSQVGNSIDFLHLGRFFEVICGRVLNWHSSS